MEELMNVGIASKSVWSAERRNLEDPWPPSAGSGSVVKVRFSTRASLILALLMSLGLWAAIWAVIASLSSMLG
jgi:hypothetical protein